MCRDILSILTSLLQNSSCSRNTFSKKVRSGMTAFTLKAGSENGEDGKCLSISGQIGHRRVGSIIALPLISIFTAFLIYGECS